ncbi:oxidoreductase, partial [Staphylococcus sp. SIMBA_130]
MSNQFKAFLVDKNNAGSVNSDFTQLTTDDLHEGEVLIKVHYSGINYKDA